MASIDKPVVKVIHVQPTASIEQVYTAPIIVLTACVQLMCSNVRNFPWQVLDSPALREPGYACAVRAAQIVTQPRQLKW
jgi:hypothetical protein